MENNKFLNETLDRQKRLMGLNESTQPVASNITESDFMNEGALSGIKAFTSGMGNMFRNMGTTFKQGKVIKQLEIKIQNADKIVKQINDLLNKNENVFKEVEKAAQDLQQAQLDAPTKQKYMALFNSITATYTAMKSTSNTQTAGMESYNQIIRNLRGGELDTPAAAQTSTSQTYDFSTLLNEGELLEFGDAMVAGQNNATQQGANYKIFSQLAKIAPDVSSKIAQEYKQSYGEALNREKLSQFLTTVLGAMASAGIPKMVQLIGRADLSVSSYKVLLNSIKEKGSTTPDQTSEPDVNATPGDTQTSPSIPPAHPNQPVSQDDARLVAITYLKKMNQPVTDDAMNNVAQAFLKEPIDRQHAILARVAKP